MTITGVYARLPATDVFRILCMDLRTIMPRACLPIAFSQVWECCALYGLRSILVLFLTIYASYSDEHAFGVYMSTVALSDSLSVFGGYIGDKNSRRGIALGAIWTLIGTILLCYEFSINTFYAGLAFMTVGVAFFRPNSYSIIGELVSKCGNAQNLQSRTDAAFSLLFLFMEIGYALLYVLVGLSSQYLGWRWAMCAIALSMLLSVLCLSIFHIKELGNTTLKWLLNEVLCTKDAAMAIVLCATSYMCILHYQCAAIVAIVLLISTFIYALWRMRGYDRQSQIKFIAFMTYLLVFGIFISIERQIYTSVSLFFDRNVDRIILGFNIPVMVLYMAMPITGIITSPVVAYLVHRWQSVSVLPGIRTFFSFSVLATGMAILLIGCHFANDAGKVSLLYSLAGIITFPMGSLIFMSSMLSMANRLSPLGMRGLFNSLVFSWFAIGTLLSKPLSSIMAITNNKDIDYIASLAIYRSGFTKIVYLATIMALVSMLIKYFLDVVIKSCVVYNRRVDS